MKSKGTQTKIYHQQTVQQYSSSAIPSKTKSKSMWRMFSNDWLPTNILGSHVGAIQNDLRVSEL
jgi:hypothetical protein